MSRYLYPELRSYQVSAETINSLKKKEQDIGYPPFPHRVHIPLYGLAAEGKSRLCPEGYRISVGTATCAGLKGAEKIYQSLLRRNWDKPVQVVRVGCIGACFAEPFVTVRSPGGDYYVFGDVDSSDLWSIINLVQGATPSSRFWARARERYPGQLQSLADLDLIPLGAAGIRDFFSFQQRRITGRCGLIDPWSLTEAAATGSYRALERALFKGQVDDICSQIRQAGLRGRGGGGFPSAEKMQQVAASSDPLRYVVANADEGDPGAYMDRSLLESDPHAVIEGLLLAAYAVNASHGYIFIRQDYALAVKILQQSLDDARKVGLLGQNILGSRFSFDITLVESGGAFVCGEETALLQIIANQRGEPQPRPPYPSGRGLYGHPVLINNVETLANIPWIVNHTPAEYRDAGTEQSPGTKIFCLTGDIQRTGFVEVPLGIPVSHLVESIGGADTAKVKAVHLGGPSGGVVAYHDFSLDYETVEQVGSIVGSGGLVVLDHTRCMVDLARHLTGFMAKESCGKCSVCRDGLDLLEKLLLALTTGQAPPTVLEDIRSLGTTIGGLAQCGLGQGAVNPVVSTLRYFSDEYQAHVDKVCPAVMCRALIDFEIFLPCKACRACYSVCPSGAVSMRDGRTSFIVDRASCTRCWACHEACLFNFIRIVSGGFLRKS